MAKTLFQLLTLSSSAFLSLLMLTTQEAKASDKLFMEQKCTKCHAISAYNIEKKKSSDDDEDEDSDGDKVEPPDLSNVGNFHDAAFLSSFMMKEVDHSPHAGNDTKKKHKVKFKGSEAERKQLADWLVTLKKEPTTK